ncbi:hypothetical protein PVL29_022014 [Vitis rotundifolia]|uniref:Uncharacterized protein n=1 Tax=Vitis rotundifolia TaxID=103349 RepID=A0AA39DC31_VITRO|nr:hypothetical protein PVL29_022014 [Vitis rotundifolia]
MARPRVEMPRATARGSWVERSGAMEFPEMAAVTALLRRRHSRLPVDRRRGRRRQFKLKAQQVKKGEDARWKLLVRKVVSAKAMSSLTLPKRKREEEPRQTVDHRHGIRSFRL